MFFQDKVHKQDVIKWGIFAGILEGIYIVIAAVLYAQRGTLSVVLASTGDEIAAILLLSLAAISAVVTTVIVFSHPLYCFIRRHYLDALLTVLLTLATLAAVLSFTLYAYRVLYLTN